MLTLVNNTNSNDEIKPEAHGLYRLSVKPSTQLAVESKPVFGANITFHSSVLQHASFIATPDNIIGWIDHGGLSYFSVHQNTHQEGNVPLSIELPSQFLKVDNGILRVTSPTRIYLIAKNPMEIHKHGLCFFSPV
ncbi:hypothetical protein D210916BOD24_12140 [Alteromonas sp. D210916BOD_24]|uniref:hypothetical protein n=1 Tax=Alteromonas sp. D210916BOD_24 TaxID=3157618 RepID=UPI00399D4C80